MAQKDSQPPSANPKKRKEPPAPQNVRFANNKKPKIDHRARQRDARTLSTQTTGHALQNGELDVDKFVKAREFEIRALEEGMQRSRKALTKRAFQQVPRELRRRTASHDAKRVPKRLRAVARKDMIQDQTPTVNSRTRKPKGHQRLRIETVKKLRALGARKTAAKEQETAEKMQGVTQDKPVPMETDSNPTKEQDNGEEMQGIAQDKLSNVKTSAESTKIKTRAPKIKSATLAKPPVPKAKFRKRQLDKSWLPTHIFHAKRAHMTPPKSPMWRFAIPLTPTQKSYRPTHRASRNGGAVAWDTSYISTIGLVGTQQSIEGMLKALGVSSNSTSRERRRCEQGSRVSEAFLCEREEPHNLIAPATIIWCADSTIPSVDPAMAGKQKRKVFIRIHPSAFFKLWEELLRLSKVAKPSVSVEDLRYEIGSIDITGPGSTEALLGAVWPYDHSVSGKAPGSNQSGEDIVSKTWTSLNGLTNPSTLPSNALLAFEAQDPRLHHPPRTIKLPSTDEEQHKLLETIAAWPIHDNQSSSLLFDRLARLKASKLPSQKAINRRKSLALPGDFLTPTPLDTRIPITLYVSTNSDRNQQSTWTLLAPWKCIQPFWYSIVFYPLSSGQQPRFAGLREKRQLAFECGQPWFPADFPGSQAGWEWEVQERRKRWDEWARRPKSKRVSWEKVDLGDGKKGEVGQGWACDWELLLPAVDNGGKEAGHQSSDVAAEEGAPGKQPAKDKTLQDSTTKGATSKDSAKAKKPSKQAPPAQSPTGRTHQTEPPPTSLAKPKTITQLSAQQAHQHLRTQPQQIPPGALASTRITLITRGVPLTCARIYRLPSATTQRQKWLDLQPSKQPASSKKNKQTALPRLPKDAPSHVVQQRLAQSLLARPSDEANFPPCPGVEDLVGFVTSGNFNLAEGRGFGVGCVLLGKVAEDSERHGIEGKLCVVRNAGESVGRLARWEIV